MKSGYVLLTGILLFAKLASGGATNGFARTTNGVLFKGVLVHNVVELDRQENGRYEFRRSPSTVHAVMNDQGRRMNANNTGVELRFVMMGDSVRLRLGGVSEVSHSNITVYHGDIVGDWPELDMPIHGTNDEIVIKRCDNLQTLREIARRQGDRFAPDVVRLVLPHGTLGVYDVSGDIIPPPVSMLPSKTYLAYGSSITHGSNALSVEAYYASRVGKGLHADVRNLGFAGSARMEPEMADFIAGEPFDFATLEMGVNVVGVFDVAEYERRVRYFIRRVAETHPQSRILAIDVFGNRMPECQRKIAADFRRIARRVVDELAFPNVLWVDGRELLSDDTEISSGGIHPTATGHERIAAGILDKFRSFGKEVSSFTHPPRENHPQTWFHLIGGNVSKEGLTADLEAIAGAGISGIQLFHGQVGNAEAWPRTKGQIPCLSTNWEEVIRHAADECARLGLKFEMQNCPGWSMSGGPWITPDKAMRRLVSFKPGERPNFGPDDDYREIGRVRFPAPAGWNEPDPVPTGVEGSGDTRIYSFADPVVIRTLELPSPNSFNTAWGYDPGLRIRFEADVDGVWQKVLDRDYPRGCWQDGCPVSFSCGECRARRWRLTFGHLHDLKAVDFVRFRSVACIDGWEALGGWCFRDIPRSLRLPEGSSGIAELEFGHVNAKMRNGPAPVEATGWECDKLDPEGFRANFGGYLRKLQDGVLFGGKLQGMVVDSWECGRQSWTWRMEEYFQKANGYELRPHLPELFGFPAETDVPTGKFLLDWRRTISRLIEENYYRVFSELGHAYGLTVQFETAFHDVIPGDPLRYWKYADIPMCEFWQPHDNAKGSVGSDDFKPVRPCVSAAHLYGKKRVQAEAFTSMSLDWNENFKDLKAAADHHFARGVTHLVFHTYTHNPHTGDAFVAPGTSFGARIGTPFIRGQSWWKFMPELTAYVARCGLMLERGKPVVDVLWYLGDDHQYRPRENAEFPEGYKYDYLTQDALLTRLDVKDGEFVLPDGMSYRVIWIPDGTVLLPESEDRLARLEAKGGRVIRGELHPGWASPLEKLGFRPKAWYLRRDGGEDIFFVVRENGDASFVCIKNGERKVLDPVTGDERCFWREVLAEGSALETIQTLPVSCVSGNSEVATERVYTGHFEVKGLPDGPLILSLGKVCDWVQVTVNGHLCSTLWCEPYACDVSPFLRRGENEIRIAVTSTWFNKLASDAVLPEDERKSWTIAGPKAGTPLRDAGLYGPVAMMRLRK